MLEGNFTEEETQDIFEGFFFRDIEKWFSADIACCDDCYDEFVSDWPLVESFNESEFEKSAYHITTIYSGGLLKDVFSEKEFNERIIKIPCPNCNSPLAGNIWPYNMPIEITDEFREKIYEIGTLARTTPSLVLTDSYANSIFQEILALGKDGSFIEKDLIGSRARGDLKIDNAKPLDFTWPLPSIAGEGRYNHAGIPVWYLSDTSNTCLHELRKPASGIVVADIKIDAEIKVLDLVHKLSDDGHILQSLVWSPLLSSIEDYQGWHKPQYAFTRFIADCAKFAGFDAIRFPSVRLGSGHNICLLKPDELQGRFTISNIRIEFST